MELKMVEGSDSGKNLYADAGKMRKIRSEENSKRLQVL